MSSSFNIADHYKNTSNYEGEFTFETESSPTLIASGHSGSSLGFAPVYVKNWTPPSGFSTGQTSYIHEQPPRNSQYIECSADVALGQWRNIELYWGTFAALYERGQNVMAPTPPSHSFDTLEGTRLTLKF